MAVVGTMMGGWPLERDYGRRQIMQVPEQVRLAAEQATRDRRWH